MDLPSTTARRKFMFVALGAVMLCLWLAGRFAALEVDGNPGRYVAFALLAGAAFIIAVRLFQAAALNHTGRIFWSVILLTRLIALFSPPGDDIWRYIWEGKIQLLGFNPYAVAPISDALEPLRDDIWRKMNHPEWKAIYPPGAQLVFAAMAAISPSAIFFKLTFALADLGVIALLLRLARQEPHRTVAWYAWNPAVILAFAGGGHYDSLMILAAVAALCALQASLTDADEARQWRFALLGALLLGISISLKALPLFLLPLWFFALRKKAIVLPVAIALPLLLTFFYGGPEIVLRPLRIFARYTRFNDLLWWFVEKTIWTNPGQTNFFYMLILGAAAGIFGWVFCNKVQRGVLWIFGAVLILSPVLHPWYVTWILPAAALRRQHGWVVFSLSALTMLLLWEDGQFWSAWNATVFTRALIIVPPLFCWIVLRFSNESQHKRF